MTALALTKQPYNVQPNIACVFNYNTALLHAGQSELTTMCMDLKLCTHFQYPILSYLTDLAICPQICL